MPSPKSQAAAIPVRDGLVCLVTSRGRGRWVIPKGMIEKDQTAATAAAAEAFEEAGLLGTIRPDPVGVFEYTKAGRQLVATTFILDVSEELTDWPERNDRARTWYTPERAAALVEEPAVRDMLLSLATDPAGRDIDAADTESASAISQ
jgi:8-oxo-dGTP pyrophosphatase MutT (NUDIX family)